MCSLRNFLIICTVFLVQGCITPDNPVIEGLGTPDAVQCSTIAGVEDGALYEPRSAAELGIDENRAHPDVFYMGWSTLDSRSDLRFPEKGYEYNNNGYNFEDKLLVSRKTADGTMRHWQLLPRLSNDCKDVEKIRIHSFDVAPNGRSLYVSMAREQADGTRDSHLGIYRFDFKNYSLTKISKQDDVHFMYPTYVGNNPDDHHEMLFVAKTVTADDIPINYRAKQLRDEYDRAPTPLIHRMDASTGEVERIGFNNSHQTEPFAMKDPDGNPIVVFTQWEHQASVNRFALWKMQIDGSDNFTFYGDEAETNDTIGHIFQGRVIKSGPYKDYVLMTESHHKFDTEGHVMMTKRHHLDLRSPKEYLQRVEYVGGSATRLARNPEHYNDESFIYSLRDSTDHSYQLFLKDYPANVGDALTTDNRGDAFTPTTNDYHFIQARSYYTPEREEVAATENDLGQSRVSFTNEHLNGKAGFLVQNLTQSDNGVQHQLDGIDPNEISMQFFVPSHHFNDSKTISVGSSPEMSIPASGFIKPESDGSIGVVLKDGLYIWKINKRFDLNGKDIWIPVRAERQEVSFVPNRVNACNQCHQDRNQVNLDIYDNYQETIAAKAMRGDLSEATADISGYETYNEIPDFHKDIIPLLTKRVDTPQNKSCADCHHSGTFLNLANTTGPYSATKTFRTLIKGSHLQSDNTRIEYVSQSINPMGMDNGYKPAPLTWSLLLNNDLTEPGDATHPNNGNSQRSLERAGDYGGRYIASVEKTISNINTTYDHSKHWSADDVQKFITYSNTQSPVGLSDYLSKSFTAQTRSKNNAAGQKAYQALVRQCFSCHNNHTGSGDEGIIAEKFGLPLKKRFDSNYFLRDRYVRFIIHSHLYDEKDTKYSMYNWKSNLENSRYWTLESALYHIDYRDNTTTTNPASEMLVYASCTDPNGDTLSEATHKVRHPTCLDRSHKDYKAIENWVMGGTATNTPPVLDRMFSDTAGTVTEIRFSEYNEPGHFDTLSGTVTNATPDTGDVQFEWSDPDGDLSELLISAPSNIKHSMLALNYKDFTSGWLKNYAIFGDRGSHQVEFIVTDGQARSTHPVTVTIDSDYDPPEPVETLPNASAYFTVKDESDPDFGKLFRLVVDTNSPDGYSEQAVGTIPGYSAEWTTVYRRADQQWLYFVNQSEQKIYVVNETNAQVEFTITLDHEKEKRGDMHKQTLYLLWWRPGENGQPGRLEGMLESKLSDEKDRNGDFYVDLGDGGAGTNITVQPTYQTKLDNGGDTLSVYVWRKATFMTKKVDQGVDELNVLNLVTGKAKSMGDFTFTKHLDDQGAVAFEAKDYLNVRAVVVAEDGAFYGLNKDLNVPATIFNFDPLTKKQKPIANPPAWLEGYLERAFEGKRYGTPFLAIDSRAQQP